MSKLIGWKIGTDQSKVLNLILVLIGQYMKGCILLAKIITVWYGDFIKSKIKILYYRYIKFENGSWYY